MSDYSGRANKKYFGFVIIILKRLKEELRDDVICFNYETRDVIERKGVTANIGLCILKKS